VEVEAEAAQAEMEAAGPTGVATGTATGPTGEAATGPEEDAPTGPTGTDEDEAGTVDDSVMFPTGAEWSVKEEQAASIEREATATERREGSSGQPVVPAGMPCQEDFAELHELYKGMFDTPRACETELDSCIAAAGSLRNKRWRGSSRAISMQSCS